MFQQRDCGAAARMIALPSAKCGQRCAITAHHAARRRKGKLRSLRDRLDYFRLQSSVNHADAAAPVPRVRANSRRIKRVSGKLNFRHNGVVAGPLPRLAQAGFTLIVEDVCAAGSTSAGNRYGQMPDSACRAWAGLNTWPSAQTARSTTTSGTCHCWRSFCNVAGISIGA